MISADLRRDMPPAVILGLSPTGLHVVRSLGEAGVEIIGVAEGAQAGASSRYIGTLLKPADDTELLETLCDRFPTRPGQDRPRPVLMATSDRYVDFIIANADRLSRHFAFQDSYQNGLASAIMAKDSFYTLCEQEYVAYPALWEAERDQLAELADRPTYPCMIKPARIHQIKDEMRGRKGWTVRSAEQMTAVANEIPRGAGKLLLQEIVPGPESNITLACVHIDRRGQPRQMFTARKLRQYPPGFGSASLVQSHDEPETARIASDFLTAIGYRGIAAAEFKPDPRTGALKIIEINVRPSLWFSVSQAAGRPVILSAYSELAGLPPLAETVQSNGVRWRYAVKDSASKLFYHSKRDFLLPPPDIEVAGAATRTVHAIFNRRDPKPVLAETRNFLQKAADRLF